MTQQQLSAFQELIRAQFPHMEENEGIGPLDITVDLPLEMAGVLPQQKFYDFVSEDGFWTLSLTEDALALTCRNYARWEEFKSWLSAAHSALQLTYQPRTFLRIGLRYLDVVQRSQLGLEGIAWPELLAGLLAGELVSPDIGLDIEDVTREFVFRLNDKYESRARVQHGFAQVQGTDETCYLIDSDFYTDKEVELRNADKIFATYNGYARRLCRWCISARLHAALEPIRA